MAFPMPQTYFPLRQTPHWTRVLMKQIGLKLKVKPGSCILVDLDSPAAFKSEFSNVSD
jgi:hypothetical protein